MSTYLQRLARPSPSATALVPPAGWAAGPGRAQAGVQEIEHVPPAGPVEARSRPPGTDAGTRSDGRPSQAPDIGAAVAGYVTRWLAGTADAQGAAPPSPAKAGSPPPEASTAPAPGTTDVLQGAPGAMSRMTRDVAGATSWTPASQAFPPPAPLAQARNGGEPAAARATASRAPEAAPTVPLASPRQAGNARHVAVRAQPSAPSGTGPARGPHGAGQVEVHIGSIALTVKVPANPAPAPAPPPAAIASTPAGATRPRAAPADTLGFSPARHHLRWS